MKPFTKLTAIAAPIEISNVDTDMILPARFLTTIGRSGLGEGLFYTQRKNPDFILNRNPWSEAKILVGLDNFGCGSSREHAPWALLDYGIRCVIAPSFADIFYNNCCKNGILPITVSSDAIKKLIANITIAETAEISVCLVDQCVRTQGLEFHFDIDPARKADLLAGTNDIDRTLSYSDDISIYEGKAPSWLPRITQEMLDNI